MNYDQIKVGERYAIKDVWHRNKLSEVKVANKALCPGGPLYSVSKTSEPHVFFTLSTEDIYPRDWLYNDFVSYERECGCKRKPPCAIKKIGSWWGFILPWAKKDISLPSFPAKKDISNIEDGAILLKIVGYPSYYKNLTGDYHSEVICENKQGERYVVWAFDLIPLLEEETISHIQGSQAEKVVCEEVDGADFYVDSVDSEDDSIELMSTVCEEQKSCLSHCEGQRLYLPYKSYLQYKVEMSQLPEPLKSFWKADILDRHLNFLNNEGKRLFLKWLLKKNGKEFKKTLGI